MSKFCTVIGTLIAKPETREELQAILSAQVEPTRAEPGCVNYDFHADSEDPCAFIFYENWRSKGDLDAHLRMPHLKPLLEKQQTLLARPVEIRLLNMLSDFAGSRERAVQSGSYPAPLK